MNHSLDSVSLDSLALFYWEGFIAHSATFKARWKAPE